MFLQLMKDSAKVCYLQIFHKKMSVIFDIGKKHLKFAIFMKK